MSSGGLWRAAPAGAGAAASTSSTLAAVTVKRPFTTAANRPSGRKFRHGHYAFAMLWRRNRADRPPRVGAKRAGQSPRGHVRRLRLHRRGRAGAGYFQIGATLNPPLPPGVTPVPTIPPPRSAPPEPGKPRTLLVLGSDRRAETRPTRSSARRAPHSDTIVLIRLDPKRNRIAVLSLPRDLAVTIPGYADSIEDQPGLRRGRRGADARDRQAAVRERGGREVHGQQRHRRQLQRLPARGQLRRAASTSTSTASTTTPRGTGFAAIDVPAGYQRLVGSDALAYVRFRHTDSDIFRNARQQDFLRQAASQRAVRELQPAGRRDRADQGLPRVLPLRPEVHDHKNIAGLVKTGISLAFNDAPVNQIKLQGITESDNPTVDTRLFISLENLTKAYDEFMTGEKTSNPEREEKPKTFKRKRKAARDQRSRERAPPRRGQGRARVPALGFPVLLPGTAHATGRSTSPTRRASTASATRTTSSSRPIAW